MIEFVISVDCTKSLRESMSDEKTQQRKRRNEFDKERKLIHYSQQVLIVR